MQGKYKMRQTWSELQKHEHDVLPQEIRTAMMANFGKHSDLMSTWEKPQRKR